jgi:hypothetical protein
MKAATFSLAQQVFPGALQQQASQAAPGAELVNAPVGQQIFNNVRGQLGRLTGLTQAAVPSAVAVATRNLVAPNPPLKGALAGRLAPQNQLRAEDLAQAQAFLNR